MRFVVLPLFVVACSNSGLSYEQVDNPDALTPIPPPPAFPLRDDLEDPYDEGEPMNGDDTELPADDASADDLPADEDCPPDTICVPSLPFVHSYTTTGGPSNIDSYACAPDTDESGPERTYQVELTEPGFLAITVFGMPAGVDVDAHLLWTPDPDSCIDRGHWDAASLLEPGVYTVVLDSWVDGAGVVRDGDYSVRFHHTAYDSLAGDGLDPVVMERALTAFDTAWHNGETNRLTYTVADFDLPSTQPRLWTVDLATGDLLFHELVAHGTNSSDPSNPAMVAAMSNINGSHMSSLGLMRAAETYWGSNGYSMRLDGLEPGYNDLVRPRAIVMHEATYATQAFVNATGYLGRSWGCPAVDPQVNAQLIDTIKNGTLFFSHFSDPDWLYGSDYL
jgi:hypothetical protein